MLSHLLVLFFLGAGNNLAGVVIAVMTFIIFLKHRVRGGKALAYSCFLLMGIAVAKLHWVIYSGQIRGKAIWWENLETQAFVGGLGILVLIASARILREELPLVALLVSTTILALFQFGGIPHQVVNWYARFFSLAAITVPLLVLARSWNQSGSTKEQQEK